MTVAAGIVGWGTAVPDGRVTNADLEARLDTSDKWIVERTGIRERRVAGPSETTATLGVEAAANAIKTAGLVPADIDLMIVATTTPEQPIPHTGAFVGDMLGLHCGSFDLNAACAGFVYELVVGASMVQMGYRHVLLVGADTLSRIIDPQDRTTTVIFGDGAGAAVLASTQETPGLIAWDLGCDGSAAALLEIRAGGSRMPATAASIENGDQYLKMAGQEVYRRAVRAVVDSAVLTLERAGTAADEVAWFVPHQANARIIEAAGNRLGFEPERTLVNIDRYGNTSSASIPLALFEAVDDGRVRDGDLVLCSGFGAGMTWASALVRWGAR
ncbi:MAG: 3-oxoacyl-[acyl-carrier-protein] synthase [Actinomycetota bacterium]|nr:3-oxoacyl-[acyl-carrier-protein] synthase [Actinomycetota bacterium]